MKSLLTRGRLACLTLLVAIAATSPQTLIAPASAAGKAGLSKLEIIGLLQARRFDELEAYILRGGGAEESINCLCGISAFEHSDPANQGHLDAWVAARPSSFVALMARGTYRSHLGWLLRGSGTRSRTSNSQFDQMRPHFLEAKEDFERALELNPKIFSSHEKLLKLGMVLGQHQFVDGVYRRAREYFPDSPSLAWHYLFAMQIKWRGDSRIFFSYWRHLMDRHGSDKRYAFLDYFASGNLEHPADLLKWEEKYEELLTYAEERIDNQEDATGLQWRAYALERLGRGEEAEADLRKAIALAPYWDDLHKDLARIYYWRNEMEKARVAVDEYVARDPYNPERLVYRAELYSTGFALYYTYTKKDEAGLDEVFQQALKDLDRAAYYGRGRSDIAAARALVLERQSADPSAVVSAHRRAVKLTPQDPRRWRSFARALYDEGNCKALPAFKQYVKVCRRTGSCRVDHYFENVIHEGGKTDQCFGLPPTEPDRILDGNGGDAAQLSPFERDFPICSSTLRTKPPEEAIKICRKKAEDGNLKAQYELYRLYAMGMLVDRDLEEALRWISMAAEAEYPPALSRLAYIHLYGRDGQAIDIDKALRYFERGMALDDPEAFIGMSRALYHGQNMAVDRVRARALLDRAITLGSQEAKRNLLRYFPADEG